jgi:hypothetical protein
MFFSINLILQIYMRKFNFEEKDMPRSKVPALCEN